MGTLACYLHAELLIVAPKRAEEAGQGRAGQLQPALSSCCSPWASCRSRQVGYHCDASTAVASAANISSHSFPLPHLYPLYPPRREGGAEAQARGAAAKGGRGESSGGGCSCSCCCRGGRGRGTAAAAAAGWAAAYGCGWPGELSCERNSPGNAPMPLMLRLFSPPQLAPACLILPGLPALPLGCLRPCPLPRQAM